ncbi:carboxylesterase/lipase family protein [Streptomyces sp. RB17]|uniref:carboxylesterase/lipase family protein n=1 Tax=Streptomyces sp. RB17 TaxID=2585197 RepID=UPI0018869407|nr:carboxylesterase family protein [Streptomyces sp. RB17]
MAPPAVSASPDISAAPLAKTEDGWVRGAREAGSDAFLGIPYAAPPTGDRRWRPPATASAWRGVRAATTAPPDCAQSVGGLLPGQASTTEDCLYLNVYRPARADAKRLPVLFWIHGGGYGSGAGRLYDGSRLAAKNEAIVVSINYRVNVFGFLSLASLDHEQGNSGNYGFLDQLAALHWVNRNIAAFGGDPGRVTIDGQSAGAFSVCNMLAAPAAKGLFSAAVLQSGGTCPTVPKASYEAGLLAVVKAAGCPDIGATAQLACLRGKSGAELLDAAAKMPGGLAWNAAAGGNALPVQPLEAVRSGTWTKVPVLLGTTRDEARAMLQYIGTPFPQTEDGYRSVMRTFFGDQADKILAEYPAADYTDPAYAEAAVLTDSGVSAGLGGCGQLSTADVFAAHTTTYYYELYDPNAPPLTVPSPVPAGYQMGSAHSADLAYLFQDGFAEQSAPFTPAQRALSDRIMRYWTNFAGRGDPDGHGQPHWPVYKGGGDGVVQLSPDNVSVMPDYRAEHRCSFWHSLGRP